MNKIPQWPGAQGREKDLWNGVIHHDFYILRVLADTSVRAPNLRSCVGKVPEKCLEVGIGPFGLGISALLPEIPHRFGLDPLPPVVLQPSDGHPPQSTAVIRGYMRDLRAPIRYIQACGEEIPLAGSCMDLVICCNVLDHASDPKAILREIYRVLKPGGSLYFYVDTFSLLGLAKWHSWTKYAHKREILVTTHPYRMYEANVTRALRAAGFQLRKLEGHTFLSNLVGHARDSTFLGSK